MNAYEVEAGIGVIAGNTVCSMPERLECEVLQKARYVNTLSFTFYLLVHGMWHVRHGTWYVARGTWYVVATVDMAVAEVIMTTHCQTCSV